MNIGLLITPLVLIGAVIYIAWPLIKEGESEREVSDRTELEIAIEAKDNLVANLKDIEMDYRMEKLSEEDYQELRADFEQRALKAIEVVDKLQSRRGRKRS